MRFSYLLLGLLVACGGEDDVGTDEILNARRAALGLGDEPLRFSDAMAEVSATGLEARLARVAAGSLPGPEFLDLAVRAENLLARADAPTAGEYRTGRQMLFDRTLGSARDAARRLARAAARGHKVDEAAGGLLSNCIECHRIIGLPR